MSQEELSKKMGYSTRNAVYQFEKKDNMKLSLIEKFAEALDTTPAYLMGWEDDSGEQSVHGRIANAYIINAKKQELFEVYDSLTPEKRASLEAYIKFLQTQP